MEAHFAGTVGHKMASKTRTLQRKNASFFTVALRPFSRWLISSYFLSTATATATTAAPRQSGRRKPHRSRKEAKRMKTQNQSLLIPIHLMMIIISAPTETACCALFGSLAVQRVARSRFSPIKSARQVRAVATTQTRFTERASASKFQATITADLNGQSTKEKASSLLKTN